MLLQWQKATPVKCLAVDKARLKPHWEKRARQREGGNGENRFPCAPSCVFFKYWKISGLGAKLMRRLQMPYGNFQKQLLFDGCDNGLLNDLPVTQPQGQPTFCPIKLVLDKWWWFPKGTQWAQVLIGETKDWSWDLWHAHRCCIMVPWLLWGAVGPTKPQRTPYGNYALGSRRKVNSIHLPIHGNMMVVSTWYGGHSDSSKNKLHVIFYCKVRAANVYHHEKPTEGHS